MEDITLYDLYLDAAAVLSNNASSKYANTNSDPQYLKITVALIYSFSYDWSGSVAGTIQLFNMNLTAEVFWNSEDGLESIY